MSTILAPVLLLEDDLLMQQRLQKILMDEGYRAQDICITSSIAQTRQTVDYSKMALALVDLGLPDGNGIEIIEEFSKQYPDTPILVISSWSTEEVIISALKSGATGYILKERDDFELRISIRSVLKGGVPIDPFIARHILDKLSHEPESASVTFESEIINLTERESQILELVATGLSNKEIANQVFLSQHTVESHIKQVYRKLAVNNRTKAVTKARQIGLLN